jgi:hypothetical protein
MACPFQRQAVILPKPLPTWGEIPNPFAVFEEVSEYYQWMQI